MTEEYTLYAAPHSLYSGRARSYMIKHNIPFVELSTGHESFKRDVLPRAKLPTIPTLVTPDSEVIRDGAAIIEYFESSAGRPSQPGTARQRIISSLFDVIGAEGLLRPAMHYRWNYPHENSEFLHYHFLHSQRDTPNREAKTQHMMNRMQEAGVAFGVNEETKELVESQYLSFLKALDTHLATMPYLLGGKPCIGDFGLIAPLYAHLGRDPAPLALMQREAIHVFRWVERMNRHDADAPDFLETHYNFVPNDEIPRSLISVLQTLAEDFVPETMAATSMINTWLEEHKPAPDTPLDRFLGMCEFELKGKAIIAAIQPYRLYLMQRVHDDFDGLNENEQTSIRELMTATGFSDLLSAKLKHRIGRSDNLEVWL